MRDICSLRLYDTERMRFSLEKRELDSLVADIISVQEQYAPLMPLDLGQTNEGIVRWLVGRLELNRTPNYPSIFRSLVNCAPQNGRN